MTTRRTTGGSVRRLAGRDLWQARYVGADGRRHSLYGQTKAEAQERLRAALQLADHGVRPVSQVLTVAAYLDAWLAGSVQLRNRPRTIESYRETVARYIVPAIGRQPLAKLEPGHVAGMLAALTARGTLSPTTVRYACSVLRIALGRALKEGKVLRNVAALVDLPAKAAHELRPLTGPQVRALLACLAGNPLEALYTAAVGLGLRQGELLGLQWADVDFDGGTITVRHSLQRGTRQLAATKTLRSVRTLALPAPVHAALRAHRKAQAVDRMAAGKGWHDRDLVFASPAGEPLDGTRVTHQFAGHLRRLGLPHQPFHHLRHAYATLQLEAGADVFEVSRSLGHADLGTTANVYAAFTGQMSAQAAARMDTILASVEEATR